MCEVCRAVHKRYRARAGYDLRLVPGVKCLFCRKKIGRAKFVEVKLLARFGQMFFAHARCDRND